MTDAHRKITLPYNDHVKCADALALFVRHTLNPLTVDTTSIQLLQHNRRHVVQRTTRDDTGFTLTLMLDERISGRAVGESLRGKNGLRATRWAAATKNIVTEGF